MSIARVQDEVGGLEHPLQAESISVLAYVVFAIDGVRQVDYHHPPIVLVVVVTGVPELVQELEEQATQIFVVGLLHEDDKHQEDGETADSELEWVIEPIAVC